MSEGARGSAGRVGVETAAVLGTSFEWNSCYDGVWCAEQWGGIYPAACTSSADGKSMNLLSERNCYGMGGNVTYVAGKRCKSLCDVNDSHGMCLGGCYNAYNSTQSGDWYASAYACTVTTPSVSNVHLALTNTTATGSYSFCNGGRTSTDTSSYSWNIADDGAGTNLAAVTTATFQKTGSSAITTQALATYGFFGTKNLQFCVTPIATGTTSGGSTTRSGTVICSAWVPLSDIVSAAAPSSASKTYLVLYKDINCAGIATSSTYSVPGQLNGTQTIPTAWNDVVSSAVLVWGSNPTVSVANVSAGFTGNTANGIYDFSDTAGLSESGSTYVWQRADNAAGSNAAGISTSTSTTLWTLSSADDGRYLRFCITPSDAVVTGTQTCSSWTYVGRLVSLFANSSYGGSSLEISYEKSENGHCFNLPDYSFNDTTSSFKFEGVSTGASTLWVYLDSNCSGNSGTFTESTPGNVYMDSNVGTYWNDQISSVRVTW